MVSCVNLESAVIMYASGGIVSMGTSGKGAVQKNSCNRVENSRG